MRNKVQNYLKFGINTDIKLKFRILLLYLLPLFFLLQDCGKKEELAPPTITITVPKENMSFNLPTKMLVEFTVKGSQLMKYIKVGIDGKNQVPLFSSKYIYPETSDITTSVELELGTLSPQDEGPYYLHIIADDGKNLHHKFQPVDLVNATLKYKGFYLFTRPSVNRIKIQYFDEDFNASQFYDLDGEFVDAATSIKNDMLFVATTVPGNLYALEFEDQTVKWKQQPESPYPEYTDLFEDGNYLYVGYENARITALSEITGLQKIGTKTLIDSVPEKIGVSGNYFIGDFKQRTGPKRTWVSFYRVTGAIMQKFQSEIKVVGFFTSAVEGAIDFIGNENGTGILGRYNFEGNQVIDQSVINEGEIGCCCKIDNINYLVSVGKTIYNISVAGGSYSDFIVSDSENKWLEYDQVNKRVFVISGNSIQIYNFPDAELVKTIESSSEIKTARMRFGY